MQASIFLLYGPLVEYLMYIPSMHPEVYYQYLDNMSLSKNFNSLHVVEMELQTKGSDMPPGQLINTFVSQMHKQVFP